MKVAGIQVRADTLKANRETIVLSMVERGAYGPIEDWDGCLDVDVLPECLMSEDTQERIAQAIASESHPEVTEWDVLRVGSRICLMPREWTREMVPR